jgi:hypothetical protein
MSKRIEANIVVIPPPWGSSQRATNPAVSEYALTRKVISVMRLTFQRHGTNASHVIGGGAGCRVNVIGLGYCCFRRRERWHAPRTAAQSKNRHSFMTTSLLPGQS